jgi:sugar phosphate isomerase/epimerase
LQTVFRGDEKTTEANSLSNDAPKLAYLPWIGFNSVTEAVDPIAKIGYSGIEIPALYFYRTAEDLNKLVSLAQSRGLAISQAGLSGDFVATDENSRKQTMERIKGEVKLAGESSVKIVKTITGPAPWNPKAPKLGRDISEGKAWELVLNGANELMEVAEKYQVYVALEACFGNLCRDYYTTKELLDRVGSKYLAINMDPSHYTLYGNDIGWVIKRLGDRIKHVHLKDAIGRAGEEGVDFMFPLLGEGAVNWKDFFGSLKSINFDGYMSIEFESLTYFKTILGGDGTKTAQFAFDEARKLIAYSEKT